ncbi:TadE/TadG family type IV pilus assembly protein [Phycicoccus sp. Root563]|uniref:TadE/TadG family type IV pilus assembly protein n=1 Tax=Phycicoccus sp. Root563 TaxID=1736562 RepID=UPI000B188AB2|nr:TadE/TadG family type IV pilus assembly protein [Phycicoccus sp. Root563]
MIRPTTRRRSTSESGASAVEFALVVPVLLLFIYGIIAFGFVFSQQISLNSSARDAARAGIVRPLGGNPMPCSDVASQVRTVVAGSTIGVGATNSDTIDVTVTGPGGVTCQLPSGASSATGSTTSYPCTNTSYGNLTVLVAFQSRPPVPLPVFNNINLQSTGVFACEYK